MARLKKLGWPLPFLILLSIFSAFVVVRMIISDYVTDPWTATAIQIAGSSTAFISDPVVWVGAAAAILGRVFWAALASAVAAEVTIQSLSPYGWHEMWYLTAEGVVVAVMSIAAIGVLLRNLVSVWRAYANPKRNGACTIRTTTSDVSLRWR